MIILWIILWIVLYLITGFVFSVGYSRFLNICMENEWIASKDYEYQTIQDNTAVMICIWFWPIVAFVSMFYIPVLFLHKKMKTQSLFDIFKKFSGSNK
jgi:hypothetical protein